MLLIAFNSSTVSGFFTFLTIYLTEGEFTVGKVFATLDLLNFLRIHTILSVVYGLKALTMMNVAFKRFSELNLISN
jgi:hypothetical protein